MTSAMPPEPKDQRAFGFLGVGFQFAATVLVLTGIGHAADRWLDTAPGLLLLGLFLGLCTATWDLLKQVSRLDKQSPRR